MHNLVKNQNNIYTYRRTVQTHSIRVSLLTKDKLEALQLVEHINITLALVYPLQKHEAVKIVHATLHKFQPIFHKQRIAKVQQYLGLDLSQDAGELLSYVVEKYIDEKLRTKAWAEKTYLGYKVIYSNLITLLNDHCLSIFQVIYLPQDSDSTAKDMVCTTLIYLFHKTFFFSQLYLLVC